ncbi:MAG: hypothetical protein JW885_13975 [Deltaproteobacteria bacterium]|nr:hypothetical protein [Candidatus Zymogenaceae bacterium]
MISLNVEASWLFGEAVTHFLKGGGNPHNTGMPANNARTSLDISGWNVFVDLSRCTDLFTIGVSFAMGSGRKHRWNNASSWEHVNMNCITPDGDFSFAHIITGGRNDGGASVWWPHLYANNSLENITVAKGYVTIRPTDTLTISVAVIWAQWTEKIGWNSLSREAAFRSKCPAYLHPAWTYGNYGYQSWEVSDDLGWEINLALSYEIMEGLTYTFEGAVLSTGDSWDYEKADGTRGDWWEVWSIVNTLQYEF